MNLVYLDLYAALINELIVIETGNDGIVEKAEKGFSAATHYWKLAEASLKDNGFSSEKEEIAFFKTVKPLFTSRIEFYNLLYQAVLFKPAELDKEKIFWANELRRIEIFKVTNTDFINYYESCSYQHDDAYFLRRNNPTTGAVHFKIYNSQGYTAMKDAQTATIIAYALYHQYIKMQLL